MQLRIILILSLAIIGCSKKEVPIVKAIGLSPVLDEIRKTGPDFDRNIVYENTLKDPEFYKKIVSRIESCAAIKGFSKESGMNRSNFILKGSRFKSEDIIESTTFTSPNREFYCVVHNGQSFVLVSLTAL